MGRISTMHAYRRIKWSPAVFLVVIVLPSCAAIVSAAAGSVFGVAVFTGIAVLILIFVRTRYVANKQKGKYQLVEKTRVAPASMPDYFHALAGAVASIHYRKSKRKDFTVAEPGPREEAHYGDWGGIKSSFELRRGAAKWFLFDVLAVVKDGELSVFMIQTASSPNAFSVTDRLKQAIRRAVQTAQRVSTAVPPAPVDRRAAARPRATYFLERMAAITKAADHLTMDQLAMALGVDVKFAWENVFNWAEEFKFKVKGDVVIFKEGDTAELDKQFKEWREKEKGGAGKI